MSSEPPGGGESDPPRGVRTRLLGDRGDRADKDVGRAETMAPAAPGSLAAVRDLQPGDDVGGYRIEHVIGEGGMGTVYGAVHPLIGKRAAIKVLRKELCTSAEAVERFVQEARAVNQIGHPNIVDAFGFGTLPDGRSWCAMEWLVGESLAERLDRRRMSTAEASAVLGDVIRALEAAHAHGVVHRDLKPDNVFLVEVEDDRPRVKLLDFGIAKLTGGRDQRVEKTRTGAMVGTPQYIAPEQARGQEVDARTDIYSLGVMAFEMLAGVMPFDADNAADLIAKHLTEVPPRLRDVVPDIPAAVDEVVAGMLAKKPAFRPPLARVKSVLAGMASGAGAEAAASAKAPTPPSAPVAAAAPPPVPAPPPVRFAPKDEPPLELAVQPRTPTYAGGTVRSRPRPGELPPKRGGAVVAIAIAVVIAAGGTVAYVMTRGKGHDAKAPPPTSAGSGSAIATSGAEAAGDATLDVTLAGAPQATIAIDGDVHDLRKGPPAVIPIAAGHHEVTVTASGFRTFHITVDAAAGAHISVAARLEKER